MSDKDLLYRRIRKLGACLHRAERYRGMSMRTAWEHIERSADFMWILMALRDKNLLNKHPCVAGTKDYRYFKNEVYHARWHADPRPQTRRTRVYPDKQCVAALKTLFTVGELSRALSKIKA